MKNVVKIKLTALQNEEHFQFCMAFQTLVESIGANQLDIEALNASFKSQYKVFDDVLEQMRKSGLTDSLVELDNLRDNCHRGLQLHIEADQLHFDANVAAAATRLKKIIDHYGNLRIAPYNKETASIYNLLQDLRNNADDLQLLKITAWVDKLDEANKNFDGVLNERYTESAALQQLSKVRTVRTELNEVYRKMIKVIEAMIIAKPGGAHDRFVDEWNARAEYYRNTINKRAQKKKSENEQANE